MDTATATPTPILLNKIKGQHMGEGFSDGSWREEEHWEEWYDNHDGLCTKKIVVMITEHKTDEENIHTHKTNAETITKEEYFKRKLAGTL